MNPVVVARPAYWDEAEFSAVQKELRENPLFEHLTRTCSIFSRAKKNLNLRTKIPQQHKNENEEYRSSFAKRTDGVRT